MAKGNRKPVAPGGASPFQERESEMGQDAGQAMERLKSLTPTQLPAQTGGVDERPQIGTLPAPGTGGVDPRGPLNYTGGSKDFDESGGALKEMTGRLKSMYGNGSAGPYGGINPGSAINSEDGTLIGRAKTAQGALTPQLEAFREEQGKLQTGYDDRMKQMFEELNKSRTAPGAVGGYQPGTPPPTSISPLPAVAAQPAIQAPAPPDPNRAIKGWTPFGAGVNATGDQAAQYITQQLQQRGAAAPDQKTWDELAGHIGWKPGQNVTGEQGNQMMRFLAEKNKWASE